MEGRIAKNTIYLYIRMVIVMIINLYMVRIVLRALGSDDYAIYQVVAGLVISFQSFSSVISTSTLRFFSYSIGEKSLAKLSEIFSASIKIYLVISIILILLGETLGIWFINSRLNIPIDRIIAANWIYQFALFALVFTLLQSPYSCIVIAHEEMGYFALVSLVETILKLIAIIIISYSSYDRLILYGLSLMIIPIISLGAYYYRVKRGYVHIKYIKVPNRDLYRDMLSFSGWHLFSAGASVGINQVNTILINLFFPLLVNTARGISLQVMSAFNSFCSSFITAIRPPLIKAYAEENYIYLNNLFNYANKFIYYMSLLIAIPLFFDMEPILKMWLGEYNKDMVLFSRLIIIYSLILVLNNPISIIIQATGKIKQYFLPVECATITCPVITYILFKNGFAPQSTYYTMIGTIMVAHLIRIYCLKKIYPQFDLKDYVICFILPALLITMLLVSTSYLLYRYLFMHHFIFIIMSIIVSALIILLCGLNREERINVFNIFKHLIMKK